MILADTSIWVAHLKRRAGHAELITALEGGVVACHPFVYGELLLAGTPVETLLAGVAMLPVASHREVVGFVSQLPKPVRRIGWVDLHLVYTALLHHCDLLTRDGPQLNLFRDLKTGR